MKKLLVATLMVFGTQNAFANYSDVLFCTIDGGSLEQVEVAVNAPGDGTEKVKIVLGRNTGKFTEYEQTFAEGTLNQKLKNDFKLIGHSNKSDIYGGSITNAVLFVATKQKDGSFEVDMAERGTVYRLTCGNVATAL